ITPNSLGAELAGIAPSKNGKSFEHIIKGIKEGKIKALYLNEDDLVAHDSELENVLSKLDLLIVHATNFNKSTTLADIVFPTSTYAEKNGTFVNFDGKIQRIRQAVATINADRALEGMAMSRLDKFGTKFDSWANGKKYDARATWKILAGLSSALGQKYKYKLAEEIFAELSNTIDAFKNYNYDDIGELGALIKTKKNELTAKV
ncbi:MAG: molybdopterin-dependent oxidoreductase, partial [Ignavibacteriaceae bacterium]|nr:molybdopterin-dependent oxidoreductase [Ignavibacteriaceae bacterium]